jgi:hypothetical protein
MRGSFLFETEADLAELAKDSHWRQWFLAYGTAASGKMRDPDFEHGKRMN